jgi:hypothetical protein
MKTIVAFLLGNISGILIVSLFSNRINGTQLSFIIDQNTRTSCEFAHPDLSISCNCTAPTTRAGSLAESLESSVIPSEEGLLRAGLTNANASPDYHTTDAVAVTTNDATFRRNHASLNTTKSNDHEGDSEIMNNSNEFDDDEIATFIKNHPNSPGANFIKLWMKYRGSPEEEVGRLSICAGGNNDGICLGGYKNYKRALNRSLKRNKRHSRQPALSLIPVPLYDENDNQTLIVNVEKLLHVERGKIIPQLGTKGSCIPLLLAGFSAFSSLPHDGIIVEAGPFAGFSSRCIAAGMKYYGMEIENSYVALDTFQEIKNYHAISQLAAWTIEENPTFSPNNTGFLWLWEKNVKSMYPPAIGRPGWINKSTLNSQALFNKTVTMISIDSAKNPIHLITQLEGIFPIKAGTIFFLMDFGSAGYQVPQFYGCLRQYVIPLYAHPEQWGFVVKRDIHTFFNENIASCYQDLADGKDGLLEKVKQQLKDDFRTTLGLNPSQIISRDLRDFGERTLFGAYRRKLEDRKAYQVLAAQARQTRHSI